MTPSLPAHVNELPVSGTVAIADRAARLRAEGVDVVDLSAARAPEPTPVPIVAAARRAMEAGETHQTPARGTPAFRRAVAEKLGRQNGLVVDPDREVLATLGVKEGILLALMATLEPGDRVLLEDPCFVSHGPAVRMAGGIPVPIPLDPDRHHGLGDGVESDFAGARAIIVCNPHNPTGAVRARGELDRLAALARAHDLWVLSDEVYERVTWGGRTHRCLAARDDVRDRTVTLMSTTKAYAMGGWRVGWATGVPWLIDAMAKLQAHAVTCVPSLAQAATIAALDPELVSDPSSELRRLWATWERRCLDCAGALARIPGVRCEPPEAGFFVWADIREIDRDDARVARALLDEQHVAVIPGSAFGAMGRGYLRITAVKNETDLRRGLERIAVGLGAGA